MKKKPLNVIISGQTKSDKIKRKITLKDDYKEASQQKKKHTLSANHRFGSPVSKERAFELIFRNAKREKCFKSLFFTSTKRFGCRRIEQNFIFKRL